MHSLKRNSIHSRGGFSGNHRLNVCRCLDGRNDAASSRGETAGDRVCDTPADPRTYPWRTTWYPEYAEESTLILYATNYLDDMVGPGIGRAQYGGVLLLYPPRIMPDIWTDRHFDFADTLEERLIAAACAYSRHRRIAFLSPIPPTAVWRRVARMFGKRLVHLPASRFSGQTLRQLRLVHVLNGRDVRSYADWFVRRT